MGQVHQLYAPRCWENAHRSLAALEVLLATAGGALLPTSALVLRDGRKRAKIRKQ